MSGLDVLPTVLPLATPPEAKGFGVEAGSVAFVAPRQRRSAATPLLFPTGLFLPAAVLPLATQPSARLRRFAPSAAKRA